MPEFDAVKQVLAQTQALERVQEAARRQGEQQQQTFGSSLNRLAGARERQVNPGEKPSQEALDPDAKKGEEPAPHSSGREGEDAPEPDAPPPLEEREIGRNVDVRA